MHEGGNSRDTESARDMGAYLPLLGMARGMGKIPGEEFKFCQIYFLIENLQ